MQETWLFQALLVGWKGNNASDVGRQERVPASFIHRACSVVTPLCAEGFCPFDLKSQGVVVSYASLMSFVLVQPRATVICCTDTLVSTNPRLLCSRVCPRFATEQRNTDRKHARRGFNLLCSYVAGRLLCEEECPFRLNASFSNICNDSRAPPFPNTLVCSPGRA